MSFALSSEIGRDSFADTDATRLADVLRFICDMEAFDLLFAEISQDLCVVLPEAVVAFEIMICQVRYLEEWCLV